MGAVCYVNYKQNEAVEASEQRSEDQWFCGCAPGPKLTENAVATSSTRQCWDCDLWSVRTGRSASKLGQTVDKCFYEIQVAHLYWKRCFSCLNSLLTSIGNKHSRLRFPGFSNSYFGSFFLWEPRRLTTMCALHGLSQGKLYLTLPASKCRVRNQTEDMIMCCLIRAIANLGGWTAVIDGYRAMAELWIAGENDEILRIMFHLPNHQPRA
jgi:hypothetical protein